MPAAPRRGSAAGGVSNLVGNIRAVAFTVNGGGVGVPKGKHGGLCDVPSLSMTTTLRVRRIRFAVLVMQVPSTTDL